MNDRYDWERDRALKQDRDPRAPDHASDARQWRAENRSEGGYSMASQYRQGYDNRDGGRSWLGADSGHGGDDRGHPASRHDGGYHSGYGATNQAGDVFGPGDYGAANHPYAANWGRGRGGYGREGWRAHQGSGQLTQRETRSRQMGGGEYDPAYRPAEGYARDDFHRGFLDRAADEVMSWWGDEDAARRREQDHREDHRGRGPADYTRSDERIREDANDRLTDDWRVDARRISVAVEHGDVTLSGTVATRQDKHRAEECVERISGVRHVQNNLRVEAAGAGTMANSAASIGAEREKRD
ncbi:BON domain-containing protein [Novosphingobium sp.]|uniref:BON domain-containing protein n=1 Tax=Novosphingobium sp. TaxID=1874826 RepID=UPI0038B7526F